ncbi:MAG: hypothetical protein ABI596_13110 [Pyrinomonadaceae bacterium]
MKLQIKTLLALLMLVGLTAAAVQTQEQPKPNPDVKHFAKDGLSFDYPNGWDVSDQSTAQLQYLSLSRAGYAGIMVRAPRAGIDSKEKEDHARQLIQEGFIQAWAKNFTDSGAKAERSVVTTEVAGGPAEGTRLTARLDGEPGHVDIYWRLIGTRLVQLAIVGSDRDIKRSEPAWDAVRNSIQFAMAPAARSTPAKTKP